jgi:hypothetical protein
MIQFEEYVKQQEEREGEQYDILLVTNEYLWLFA